MDGNTAALKQHHAAQDRFARDHQAFGARVVEELIDELMQNKAVTTDFGVKVDLAFILDGESLISEVAALIAGSPDQRADLLLDLEARAKARVVQWVHYSDLAAEVIADRVRDLVLEAA